MKITDLKAIEILDSRGKPTVRTFVTLDDGTVASSSVPSGASTGKYEAVELRDGGKRHHGQGVQKAVDNVNTLIKKEVVGLDVNDIEKIDETMRKIDGTENKGKLGANAILSVSQAATRAAAQSNNIPLWKFIHQKFFADSKPGFPRFMVNVVNGGKHASWNFDIQEFMVVPKTNTPSQAAQVAAEIFHQLGKNFKKQKLSTLVGDEGGYSPLLASNEQVLDSIINAATECGYKNTEDYTLALDCAATEFYKDGKYILQKTNQELSPKELMDYYLSLEKKYAVASFEDPFAEDDWDNFRIFTEKSNKSCMTVGDDLYVTNPKRIEKGIKEHSSNAVLIKLNQIGSVTETIQAIKMTMENGWQSVISHRSGDTEDTFIADLAYASASGFIKTGSMSRSERLAKYNRLIEIENNL